MAKPEHVWMIEVKSLRSKRWQWILAYESRKRAQLRASTMQSSRYSQGYEYRVRKYTPAEPVEKGRTL